VNIDAATLGVPNRVRDKIGNDLGYALAVGAAVLEVGRRQVERQPLELRAYLLHSNDVLSDEAHINRVEFECHLSTLDFGHVEQVFNLYAKLIHARLESAGNLRHLRVSSDSALEKLYVGENRLNWRINFVTYFSEERVAGNFRLYRFLFRMLCF